MEETIKAKKTFASNFMKCLENNFNDFEDKLSPNFNRFVKYKIEEININKKTKENIKYNKIGFKSSDFGRLSIQEILLDLSQEIKKNIHNEITKDLKETDENKKKHYTFEAHEDVYKTTDLYLSLSKSKNNLFLKTFDNKNIEVYISRVRYIIYLSDHFLNEINHPVCSYKYDLIFITEVFRHCIDAISFKRPICKFCFRQIGNSKDKNSQYNKKYCHKHKDCSTNYNLSNVKNAYEKLSKSSKYRLEYYQQEKHINGDSVTIDIKSDLHFKKKRIISLSYHPTMIISNKIQNIPINFEVTEDILDLPNDFEDARIKIKNRVGESGIIFKSAGFFYLFKYLTALSHKKTQLEFNQLIKNKFPLTFASFTQDLPVVNSLDQYIRILNQKEYLDNEHDPTLNFYWLVESFFISEDILDAEREVLKEQYQKETKEQYEKAENEKKVQDRIIQLFDEGETVITKIKAILDSEDMRIGRQKITDIIKDHKEAKSKIT